MGLWMYDLLSTEVLGFALVFVGVFLAIKEKLSVLIIVTLSLKNRHCRIGLIYRTVPNNSPV